MATAAASVDVSVFDSVAASYEAALNQGLRLSGEGPEYFASQRVEWTARVIGANHVRTVLDFGCGIGLAAPLLATQFHVERLWGFDPSRAAIERAQRDLPAEAYRFVADAVGLPAGEVDLTYCNGVFHHIPSEHRNEALATVWRALRPGGWFALWENNPWNPGTRWVMSRIPFDRGAETLSPVACRRMLRKAGFEVVRTDAWFLFPHILRWLRLLERLVHRLPLGGQYLVLARKPDTEFSL
jgi:SAM-dependent methyltransferase